MNPIFFQAFGVALTYVGLRSFQQLNVMHSKYRLIPPVSMLMAIADWWTINKVVSQGWHIAIAIGIGGATGACISVWAHKRFVEKK